MRTARQRQFTAIFGVSARQSNDRFWCVSLFVANEFVASLFAEGMVNSSNEIRQRSEIVFSCVREGLGLDALEPSLLCDLA